MSLLFDAPLIPGLVQRDAMIDEREELGLLEQLAGLELSPFKFQNWVGKRQTRSFGWRYDFDASTFTAAEEFPKWLLPLREKAAALAHCEASAFAHALIARYDPGAGIGWHRDRPVFEDVVGFSLGSAAVLRFRQRSGSSFRRAKLLLPRRSAYLLSGEARHAWEHSITPGQELRFSITFRTLSALGVRKAAQNQQF